MIKLLLIVFAAGVFVLLAGDWFIHQDQVRWAEAAIAAFITAFLPFSDIAVPKRKKPSPKAE